MGRKASPPASEADFDISGSLFAQDGTTSREETQDDPGILDAENLVSGLAEEDDSHDDDEAFIAEHLLTTNRKATNLKGKSVKKGGAFHSFGLNATLLQAIARKGFSVPTPIQRKTIPLLLQDKDVVGMARTGSGKTGAFVIPMIEKLKAHSARVGARALILTPARELALQTLQVVKELGRGTDLRSLLLVGGDSLEEQFSAVSNNPDIIIATPGRFLHLKVEMGLDLSSIRYVVFDEADRLFEMGFASQLTEIIHALSRSRQTLLFSATLPKSLVEFARAGLQEPTLIRLDAESKISPDLQSAFFSVKPTEKEAALLHVLQDVIKMPSGQHQTELDTGSASSSKKRKRDDGEAKTSKNFRTKPSPHSTILFVATKHHVEYLAQFLRLAGYAVSYIYSSLDQVARKAQVQAFRSGRTTILVATDIGARGIDIPILANVINYNFPSQPKVFVHRVGRTARAGQRGWSYSLISDSDAPYLLDLQLFLGRTLVIGQADGPNPSFTSDVVVGSLPRDQMQNSDEWVTTSLHDTDLSMLRSVAMKGEKQYQRSRNSASSESVKRAKALLTDGSWNEPHALFKDEGDRMDVARERMLAKIGGFRPQESIFEIAARRGGRKANEEAIGEMRKIRSVLDVRRKKPAPDNLRQAKPELDFASQEVEEEDTHPGPTDDLSSASESELEVTFTYPKAHKPKSKVPRNTDPSSFRDTENFMPYLPASHNLAEDRGFGVHSGEASNFTSAARGATMDLATDDTARGFGEARGIMRWDKRHKKYVSRANDEDGSRGGRLVRGESGAKIAASFRSGRFEAWKKAKRVDGVGRVGELEKSGTAGGGGGERQPGAGKRFRHQQTKAPRPADRLRGDFFKKRKQVQKANERVGDAGRNVRSELKSVDDVRKSRRAKEKRKEKNARPARKGRR